MVGLIARIGGAPSWTDMQELRLAVRAFATGGKPTLAWAETFAEQPGAMAGYVLATAFDELWLQPGGELGMLGVGVQIEKLSETAYFVVDGIPMRELRLVGRKPGYRPATAMHQAVYLGPLVQVVDDLGNVFRRGVPTRLNVHDWQMLSKSSAAGSFLFLKPEETPVTVRSGR